jgi:aryl-alcohol dehydrogenase-like predicted oxidoreductase
MQHATLGSLRVSRIGLGAMTMAGTYTSGGGLDDAESIRAIHRALDLGVTHIDTAESYGPFHSEEIVGRALQGRRDQVVLATKFGILSHSGDGLFDSSPANIRTAVEGSLKRLRTDRIDLYYQHRVDQNTPIEDVIGTVTELIAEGKVLHIGLSEASPDTIRRAHAVHPIAAVQSEYSLWSREPEAEVLPVCRELGIGFVPYSPLGRGLLTGTIRTPDTLGDDDWRRTLPRFQADNMAANAAVIDTLAAIAANKGVTSAQLALAWVLHQGDFIVPIPGARKIRHLEDNTAAAKIKLDAGELTAIGEALSPAKVAGKRYTEAALALVNG